MKVYSTVSYSIVARKATQCPVMRCYNVVLVTSIDRATREPSLFILRGGGDFCRDTISIFCIPLPPLTPMTTFADEKTGAMQTMSDKDSHKLLTLMPPLH